MAFERPRYYAKAAMIPPPTKYAPVMLDLFCGAGGAAMGYHRAGFKVVGIDHKPQPRYPFEFHQYDALDMLGLWLGHKMVYGLVLSDFDAIHASPPCQAYSALKNMTKSVHPELVPETRALLQQTGTPWVMENVPGAPMDTFVTLCGSHFGLSCTRADGSRYELRRHRLFETSWTLLTPDCQHGFSGGKVIGVYGHGDGKGRGFKGNFAVRKVAMGIDWMRREELSQAVPPAYTEFIGSSLMQHLKLAA